MRKAKIIIDENLLSDYIGSSLDKANLSIEKIISQEDLKDKAQVIKAFNIKFRYLHYLEIIIRGEIDDHFEADLRKRYVEIDEKTPAKKVEDMIELLDLKSNLIALYELAAYYAAVGEFNIGRDNIRAFDYIILFSEINGMLQRFNIERMNIKVTELVASGKSFSDTYLYMKKQEPIENAKRRWSSHEALKIQTEWQQILDFYDDWQRPENKKRYPSLAKFIQDMTDKFENIKPTVQVLGRKLKKRNIKK